MRDSDSSAQRWMHKAEREEDPFDRYMALWIAFNALYARHYEGNERQAIKDFVDAQRARFDPPTIQQLLVQPAAMYFQRRIIRNGRRNGHDTRSDAIKLKQAGAYAPHEQLKALLMILYQVRNNLFHGNKEYGHDSDAEVLRNAASALMAILQAYLSR